MAATLEQVEAGQWKGHPTPEPSWKSHPASQPLLRRDSKAIPVIRALVRIADRRWHQAARPSWGAVAAKLEARFPPLHRLQDHRTELVSIERFVQDRAGARP